MLISRFCYKEYVFQLSVDINEWDDDCTDCKLEKNEEDIPHFAVMVYGRRGEAEEDADTEIEVV